ncbi:putative O-methyltransferase YrrM [Kineosphaera limosa]|uniref:Putative methyltransferase n=1 Tax=Kineosphaera limosa NBRC 100340 TaxID=1184609 RepID=K6WV75_9MICO|nr:O-methyltransferase [Kineosphaera limosa]NYE02463.1 putative O-methyltransferase YrrM [Kineosphaera limosa]GAB96012.1 putative methyltransferase [Kineosphaera limosa NBRC 100340]
MSVQKPASWSYTEEFLTEPPAVEAARRRGEELGCTPLGVGVGAALRLLAGALRARTVCEIGTGAGVSGLWLLDGMAPEGVLTTIDIEPAHQRAARTAFREAGMAPQRTRVIMGNALSVLPRLADRAYDMVFVDGRKEEYPAYVEQASRLLRSGGVLALDNMLWHDKVADPVARDATTTTLRDLGKALRDHDAFQATLLPVGDGLLAAVKR